MEDKTSQNNSNYADYKSALPGKPSGPESALPGKPSGPESVLPGKPSGPESALSGKPIAPKGWYSRGYLPHIDETGLVQHITFHLADSLPREVVEQMKTKTDALSEKERDVVKRKRIQELLDSGIGSCILERADCARIVEDSLLFGDGVRYQLLAWVVMPNHVHVLIEQNSKWPLGKVVQSWKRHTTREFRKLGLVDTSKPSLWQRDYWDRFIRDEAHFVIAKEYIENNPVKAGLVDVSGDWSWGSARQVQTRG